MAGPGAKTCLCLALLVALFIQSSNSLSPDFRNFHILKTTSEFNNAPYMLGLLRPALVHTGTQSPQLYVIGTPRWLGPFLADVQDTATVLLIDNYSRSDDSHFRFLTPSSVIVLIAEDKPSGLTTAFKGLLDKLFSRVDLWTYQTKHPEKILMEIAKIPGNLHPTQLVVFLAEKDNCANVYRLSGKVVQPVHALNKMIPVGRWVPPTGWLLGSAPLFQPCYYQGNESSAARIIKLPTNRGNLYYNNWGQFLNIATRALKTSHFQTEYLNISSFRDRFQSCEFDVSVLTPPGPNSHLGLFSVTPSRLKNVFAWVPRGMARMDCLVDGVTSEFTNSLWTATASSLILVIAALVVFASRSANFLDALAPLVAQPASERSGPVWRLIMGSWLLVCVVLSAAYTGTLLTQILAKCSAGNIRTIDEVLASNLTVYIPQGEFLVSSPLFASLRESGRLKSFFVGGPEADKAIQDIAEHRNGAMLLPPGMRRFVAPPKLSDREKIHAFITAIQIAHIIFIVKKGFPYEETLRKTICRVRESGLTIELVNRFENINDIRLFHAEKSFKDRPEPKPLDLHALRSAFLVLGFGHLLATATFIGEIGVFYRQRRISSEQPRRRLAWT